MGLAIAFDSKNRPYFLADRTGTLTGKIRTLRNGLWHDIDYSTAGWTGFAEKFYTEVTIDSSNALYASMSTTGTWRLLYSPDITASSPVFHTYDLPNPVNIEKNMSHGDNSNPPAIIAWDARGLQSAQRARIRLYIPSKNSDGTLSLSDSLDLASTHAEPHYSHSGGTPSVVSKNGKIHVTYLSEKDASGNDSNSSRIWVATIDRATKNIDHHAHLAQTHGYPNAHSGADNHSMPVIGITSTDTVIVLLGTHGETFPYYKATSTNTTSTLTNQNSNVPNVSRQTTYVDLVIDDGDTLHTSYRSYSSNPYLGVGYSRRPRSATAWDAEKILLAPDVEVKNNHSVPHQRLFMDRQSGRRNLYLVGLDEGTNQGICHNCPFQWFSAYPTPLISTTDGGSSWSLMTRYDLLGRINDGKTVQRITFPAIPNKYPNEVFYLNATTNAFGLTVSYEVVSGSATLVGNKVTVGSGTGEVVIKAKNSGDVTYYADEVTRRFQVATATISNLAQGKPAYQSGTLNYSVASRAVDGNTGGSGNQVSHTEFGSENWWEVDLGSVSYIDNIQIYNRTDCPSECPDRLSNYYVFVSDVRFTGTSVAASRAQSGVGEYHQSSRAGRPTTIANVNRTGRYVRVQLTGSNYLHMAEVKVNGSYSVADTAPDAFTFTAQNGVMPSTTITSNTVTISGLNGAAPISVTGGTLVVDGNDFTGATITNAQTVAVKVTSSSAFRTATTATVTIGGVSADFSVTTDFSMATDRMPTFGQQTISNQAWSQNQAITAFTLPTASGGNGTLTYTLSPSLPRGVTRNTTTQRVSGTPSVNQAATTYTWKVTDIDNDPATLTFTIAVNGIPTANAGDDQTVDEGDAVSLSGSGTDPESSALTYSWTQTGGTPTVTLTGATTQTPSFTAPDLTTDATLTFTLTVSDGSLTGTDTVEITVTADPNRAPVASSAIAAQTLTVGSPNITVNAADHFSDPDGDALTYTARSSAPDIVPVSVAGAVVTIRPAAVGDATITVTANDGTLKAEQTIEVAVIQAAHTPETTPDAFSFTPRTQVSPSATVTSNAITVSGLSVPASISVRGGTLVVDGSTFTGATVANGQTVAVQVRASSRYAATTTATVTIGGVSVDFSVTTRTPNTTPGSFSFTAQTGVDPGATVTSNAITVRGLEAPTSISVSGGTLVVNGRAFSGSTITNRQTVAVQVTASVGFNTTTIATVTIGGVSADFVVTTAEVMLNEITFSAEELSVGINEAFDPTTLTYTADVAHAESRLTGTAAAATGQVAIITPDDADPELAGHQVDLAVGTTAIIFQVTASDGTTARYYTVLVRRPPGQVTGVTIEPRAGQLVVSWEQVPGADGYKVQWKTDDQAFDDVRQMTIISGTTTTATIPNLTAGTTYSVQVIATETDAGAGTASTPSTDMPRAAPPGQVTGVQVMAGVGQLHVSWTAVPGADGYKVQWKTGAQAYDPATRQATVPDTTAQAEAAYDRTTRQAAVPIPTSYIIPGLAADTQYTVRVIATRTLADDGMPSAEATGTPNASLLNNPNPFNASTMIHYALAHGQPVRLTIYNVLGQVVARLVDGYQAAGVYHVRWEAPRTLASGVYLVRLRLREDVQIRRILLIK